MTKILILGVGNILLADEGFGPAAIDFLQKNYIWPNNVRLVDGGTGGLMLMAELLESDLALIIDVMLAGHEPGTFYQIADGDLASFHEERQSMHQTGIAAILASCELLGQRPESHIFAIEPQDITSVQAELTDLIQARLPQLCQRLVDWLRVEKALEITCKAP